MKVKKTKLPENLYHYTSLIKYRMISATGKLVLTPSNLKYDGATFHQEPLYFNGHEIGIKAVDKYENYHPVVWLTANDHAGAKNTGLSNDKIMCRITIKTNGKIWRYLPWRTFCDKYNADRSVASTLKPIPQADCTPQFSNVSASPISKPSCMLPCCECCFPFFLSVSFPIRTES